MSHYDISGEWLIETIFGGQLTSTTSSPHLASVVCAVLSDSSIESCHGAARHTGKTRVRQKPEARKAQRILVDTKEAEVVVRGTSRRIASAKDRENHLVIVRI